MSKSDRVIVEVVVAAPIDVVWRALREPVEIARWFGWDHPGLAEEIDFIFHKASTASEADHTLRAIDMPDRIALEAVGDQTIVRVIRSAPVSDVSWRGIYDDVFEGWTTFVQQLRFALERQRGAARRTLFLNGRARAAGTALPAEALGLGKLSTVPVGERYAITTPFGERLEGSVWFRAPYQLGLTVDGFGNGLLIPNNRPKTDKSPYGGGNLVITTYALSDKAFAALRDRWEQWWAADYEVIEVQLGEALG
jgi:uncharacterized protein YndB with AHSA1/START domain